MKLLLLLTLSLPVFSMIPHQNYSLVKMACVNDKGVIVKDIKEPNWISNTISLEVLNGSMTMKSHAKTIEGQGAWVSFDCTIENKGKFDYLNDDKVLDKYKFDNIKVKYFDGVLALDEASIGGADCGFFSKRAIKSKKKGTYSKAHIGYIVKGDELTIMTRGKHRMVAKCDKTYPAYFYKKK